jgi:hypothetical protein
VVVVDNALVSLSLLSALKGGNVSLLVALLLDDDDDE